MAVHNSSVPFIVDDATREAAPILQALIEGTSVRAALERARGRRRNCAARCSTCLDIARLRSRAQTKFARRMLIRLFSERVRYLRNMLDHVESSVG